MKGMNMENQGITKTERREQERDRKRRQKMSSDTI